MLFFLFVFVYLFFLLFFFCCFFCSCCFLLLLLLFYFFCVVVFSYLVCLYYFILLFHFILLYFWFVCFLVSLYVSYEFPCFFSCLVVFSNCCQRKGRVSTQFLLSFFFLLFFSRRNGYFNSLVGWVKDSSSAGQSMTYVSVLGAYSSFVGFGWIKNYLLLYLSRMYFFTNYLQFLHVLYVCTCICLCLCVFVCAPMRGCTVICQLC